MVLLGVGVDENGGHILAKSVLIMLGNRVLNCSKFALLVGHDWLKIASWVCVDLGAKMTSA